MEAIGLVLGVGGLAGVFSALIDISDRVRIFRRYDAESRHLIAQFEADKRYFLVWTQQLGISNGSLAPNHDPRLDDGELVTTISHVLRSIYQLLKDVNLKLASLVNQGNDVGPLHGTSDAIIRDAVSGQSTAPPKLQVRQRLAWSTNGKSRFKEMIDLFAGQVDRLYNLIPPSDSSLDRYDDMVRRFDNLSTNMENLAHSQASSFSMYKQDLTQLLKQSQAYDRERLEVWIDATSTLEIYNDRLKDRTENTCSWIQHRDAYCLWSSQDQSERSPNVFWLHAPPGFGKSVLCASIVKHLEAQSDGKIVHFFCSAGLEVCRKPLSIIRSWLMQAISQDDTYMKIGFRQMEASEQRTASTSNIWKLFDTIVQQDLNMTFVVDGFDECVHSEATTGGYGYVNRSTILERIHKTIANTKNRLLIVSRDESDIRSALSLIYGTKISCTVMEYALTRDDVQSDVHIYSRQIVDEKLSKKDRSLKEDLAKDIAENCQGMFLWIKLQSYQLRGTQTPNQLRRIVKNMPHGLENAYMRDWQRILALPNHERERAIALLRWVTFSARPMTVFEIIEALLVTTDEECTDLSSDDSPDIIDQEYINEELLRLSGSLLELHMMPDLQSPGLQIVTLVHFSVRTFLLSMLDPEGTHAGESMKSNVLAKSCLRYLEFRSTWDEDDLSVNELGRRPFRVYAANAWFLHIDHGGLYYQDLCNLTDSFFISNNKNWKKWRNLYENEDKMSVGWIPGGTCYYASFFNLLPALRSLRLQSSMDVNEIGGKFGSALQAACVKGLLHIVQYLLNHGANVNLKGGVFGCAINAAALHGHLAIVALLLESNADLTIPDDDGYTALSHAAMEGHLPVVDLLIASGADYSAISSKGFTPLLAAARYNRAKVVEYLLQKGADYNVKAENNWTALSMAVAMGHTETVRILLDFTADPAIRQFQGRTALQLAASNGFLGIVQILLERGAPFDKTTADHHGWTPLLSAASMGNTEVVKLLLDKGVDIDGKNVEGCTALILSVCNGHYDTVKTLLERGASYTVTDNLDRTPLFHAVYHSKTDIITLLIQNGADLRCVDAVQQNILHIAAMQVEPHILELLLNHGLKFNGCDEDSYIPLIRAVSRGRLDVVKLLLSHGYDPNMRDYEGRTVLFRAICSSSVKMVQLLIDMGADPNMLGLDNQSALSGAAIRGEVEIARILIASGADINNVNEGNWTPLHEAIYTKQHNSAKLLFRSGANPNISNTAGWGPLHTAAFEEDLEMLSLLLQTPPSQVARLGRETSINIAARTNRGHTALHIATVYKRPSATSMLVSYGADPSLLDCFGRSCVDWAYLSSLCLTAIGSSRDTYIATPHAVSKPIILALLSRLLNLQLLHTRKPFAEMGSIGKALQFLGSQELATEAYTWRISKEYNGMMYFHAFCDDCEPKRRIQGLVRYVCSVCGDSDLCGPCYDKSRNEGTGNCAQHEMLKVSADGWQDISEDERESAIREWLLKVQNKYRDQF